MELLTIQKFVTLLDDFHYTEFCRILQDINARLPLKLTTLIRERLPDYDSHEELCRKVYGGFDKNQRQSFNQLASYTFKLSAQLVQNYPGYLLPNLPNLQRLICDGKSEQADFLAKTFLSISSQIEHFGAQILVLKTLTQEAFHRKDFSLANKYNTELQQAYDAENTYNAVLTSLRTSFYQSQPRDPAWRVEMQQSRSFCEQHFKSEYASIRMLSYYAYLYLTYHFDPENFESDYARGILENLERDLVNYGYVSFHALFDMKSNLWFLKLNTAAFRLDDKVQRKEYEQFVQHYKEVKFWNNYLNIPELLAITIKVSYYLSGYHYQIHRPDYHEVLGVRQLEDIQTLIKECEMLISRDIWSKYYKNDLINLKLLYSALLILSGGENIKKGLNELEGTLITFQQVNFTGSIDSAFIFLMIGYFSLKQYSRCTETYKRYMKITKGTPIFEDNDIGIHTYYYLSNWLATQRRQYIVKLQANYERTFASDLYKEPRHAMEEFVRYFALPIELKKAAAQI